MKISIISSLPKRANYSLNRAASARPHRRLLVRLRSEVPAAMLGETRRGGMK